MQLPVFGVFWRAINFTILELPSIVRLTWLPLGLLAAVTSLAGFATFDGALGEIVSGYQPWSPGPVLQPYYEAFATTHMFSVPILQIIASAAAAVSLHRIVLFDDRQPGRYFAFPYGWTELLYTLMMMFSSILVMLAVLPILVLIFAIGPVPSPSTAWLDDMTGLQTQLVAWTEVAQAQAKASPLQALAMLAIFVFGFVFVLWLSIRMFVWPAAVVARRSLSFSYAWSLTKGSAWAIFGLYLLSIVLIWGVMLVLLASFPSAFFPPFAAHPENGIVRPDSHGGEATAQPERLNASSEQDKATPPQIAPGVATALDENITSKRPDELLHISERLEPAQIEAFWRWWGLNQLAGFLLNFLLVAYGVALVSYAYRALSGHDPANPDHD